MSISLLLATLLLLSFAFSAEKGMAAKQRDIPLRFKLEAQKTYVIGRAVEMNFTLENLSDTSVYVLKWYTPLEGLKGKIFRVTRNSAEIPYEGRMIKRGNPGQNDYLRIGPRSSVSAQVDLSLAYNFTMSGEYHVEFMGRIHDVASEGDLLPRSQDSHHGMSVQGNPVTFCMVKP